MEFLFIDGEKFCVYKDGKVQTYSSSYIEKYRAAALQSAKNSEWKKKGRTEMLLNEDFYFENDESVFVALNAVVPTEKENELIYAFNVNDTSGIYLKYLDDEKKTEAHIISSNEVEFCSLFHADAGLLATVKKGEIAADIAIFSKDKSDYKCVTGGDSLDENPSFKKDGKILFNSYGVGRDENNNFVGYGGSEIYELDLSNMDIKEVLGKEEYSFIKPIEGGRGFYCIKKPVNEKERNNPLLEILMIPVRIVQGIVGFVSFFVTIFSGKSLVSDSSRKNGVGGAMARNFKKDERRLFVLNNFIQVDKEMKKNRRENFQSFIPKSWKLVEVETDVNGGWTEGELMSGTADYCILDTGEIIATNGKYIFSLTIDEKEKKVHRERLVDTDCCLKVFPAKIFKTEKNTSVFDLI